MHAMRGELRTGLALLSLVALAACGGGKGAPCIIDSDCTDLQQVCIQQRCTTPGTMPEGGTGDGGSSEAGAGDGGGMDSGALADAGDAAAPSDGSTSEGGPACANVVGTWSVAVSNCGSAAAGQQALVTSGGRPCTFTAMSADSSMPVLDGTFTLSSSNALSGSLSAGGAASMSCTGSYGSGALNVSCGCVMALNPG